MADNVNRQFSSTSRLSASAEPFALKRPLVPQSKAHSFDLQSSCFDYTSEGLEEFYDLSDNEAVVCGGEFSGSNWFPNSGGSLSFGPTDGVEDEKKSNPSGADRSSEKEGISAYKRSKSLDGTGGFLDRTSTAICEIGAHAKSPTEEQIAVKDPSLVKSGHPINTTTVSRPLGMSTISLNVKPKDPGGGGLVEGSFILVDKNDLSSREPDEDSPCWRGTMNSQKSPFTPTQCTDTKFPESTSEASWTLNPMAPDFIPRSAATSGVCLVFPEESPQFLEEENITFRDKLVNGMISQVPWHDMEDISVNEALLGNSKYLSTCPSLDAELVVSTMHDLSESLVRKCSETPFLSEPLLEKVQGIIQNLSIYAGKRSPERSPVAANDSSGDTSKMPNTEFHSYRRKIVISTPELGNVSDSRRQKTDSSTSGKKVWDSCTFMGNIDAEIAQANSNASVVGLETDRRVAPPTLLYKNLWLQATEELHSMKGRSLRSMKSAGERFPGKVS